MQIRRMGRTGLKVTEVCLGTMTFGLQCDDQTSFAIMDASADLGVNFIDTADVYPLGGSVETTGRTEEIVGAWLKGRRDDYVLATKCMGQMGRRPNDVGLSRKHIIEACENSLRRLQTDYIDLYQAHSPDPETPLDESLRAYDDLVRSGKVRYIGSSNFPAWKLALSLGVSERLNVARFDCDQPRYNVLFREIETEILPLCRDQGVGVIAYNPLAGGFLTGKYQPRSQPVEGTRFTLGRAGTMYQKRYWNDACFDAVEELREFFTPREKPLAQVAIQWVLRQPGITSAIVGASKPEQLRESLGAVDLKLEEDELEALNDVWYKLPRASDPTVALR